MCCVGGKKQQSWRGRSRLRKNGFVRVWDGAMEDSEKYRDIIYEKLGPRGTPRSDGDTVTYLLHTSEG